MSNSLVELSEKEIFSVVGGGACGQDVTGAIAAGAGIVGVVFAPVSLGVSLGAAALLGFAAGIFAGKATRTCR